MRTRAPWWVVLLIVAGACQQQTTDRTLVDDLRVLAIRATPPEAAPGATVQIDALVADPKGGGRAVSAAWGICTPDFVKGVSSCAEPGRTLPAGVGTSLSFTVGAGALDTVPPEQQLRGIDLFLVVSAHADANNAEPARDVIAFKKLRVSTSPTPNRNPKLIRFALGGDGSGPYAAAPGEVVELEVSATLDSYESYVDATGMQQKEGLKFSWLQTAGEYDTSINFQDADGAVRNRWIAHKGAPPATLWVVARDGRGGVAWARRDVIAK